MKKNYSILKLLFTMFVLVMINKTNNAQNQISVATIKGIVADAATQKPLSFISINLLNKNKETLKVAVTNESGMFAFNTVAIAPCFVVLSSVGYVSQILAITTLDSLSTTINFQTIYLEIQSNALADVTVIAKKALIKREIDRIAYNVQADPESKVLNLLEIMKKVPYLSVDGDNNILLKGNGSYKILINGKPSGLVENNPKEFLKTIPAATIQRIEVITNPSSKYDAEGLAGIINIVMNKKINNGYTGSVNLNQGFPTAGSGIGTSASIKQGKLGITAYAGANKNTVPNATYTIQQQANKILLEQNGNKKSNNKSSYFGSEISYEIDSLNLIAGQFNAYGNSFTSNKNLNSITNNAATIFQAYDANNNGIGGGNGLDAAINYQLGFKANKNRLLTFSYRYYKYQSNQQNNIALNNKFNINMPNYNQNTTSLSSEKTMQVDFVRPIKKLYFEAGIKGIFRNNNSNFKYASFNNATNEYLIDVSKSDEFFNTQNILSAYTNLQFSIKSWNFQTGVRAEQTLTNVDFTSTTTQVNQNYFNIIPSASIQKQINNNSSFNVGFNQRIKRPGINRLNPFIDRSNPVFLSAGNPNLRAVLNNDMQLGYSLNKKVSLNIGLGYSFTRNIDLRVITFDTVTKINFSTFQNTGKASRLGIDFNVNYDKIKNLNLSINGNIAYFFIQGFADNQLVKNNLFTYYMANSVSYNLNKGWQLNASVNINSQNPTGLQGVSNSFVSSSFSCNKEIIKNILSFSAYSNNPFTEFRYNKTNITSFNFVQTSNYQEFFRTFGFSFNYRFGKMNSEIKKNKREINNNDVAN